MTTCYHTFFYSFLFERLPRPFKIPQNGPLYHRFKSPKQATIEGQTWTSRKDIYNTVKEMTRMFSVIFFCFHSSVCLVAVFFEVLGLIFVQGRPSPLRQWCISPCFRLPYFRKISRTPRKISPIWPFQKKIPIFIRQNFLRPFFSHSPQISNFLPISLFQFISPHLFREIFLSLFLQISPLIS